jgi:ABC-2 type transport system ATP-binding protein
MPGVLGVKQAGATLSLRVARLHDTLPRILELMQATGAVVAELRTHAPTLEDVFVALTGRHLRDE